MRNLRNTRYSTWELPTHAGGPQRQISATAWDASSDSIIVACGPDADDALIQLWRITNSGAGKLSQHELITSWDAPSPNPDLTTDKILNLHYFSDTATACLVLQGGDIIIVRSDPLAHEDRIEIVGSVDAGITAAKWSPDEELLAITTAAQTLVFMSRGFEGIMDVAMTAEDVRASNHVSVGWGKKETQFKGRGVKAMRDPTMPEKVDEGVLSAEDGGEVSISWRGDGAFVAVNSVEGGKRRMIRVYSREGVSDSVGEPVDGLVGALSWRPAGNLMAGIQRLEDRTDVVFFERNGLRHGQFSLREKPNELAGKQIKLAWNNDSTVLAITIGGVVQLWTMGNYHWYLKQELGFLEHTVTGSYPVVWHPEKPLSLLVTHNDAITLAEYTLAVARSSVMPPFDFGAVAVIDGTELKLTPLRTANVPPPAALYDIEISGNVVDVAFNADCSSVAVLHGKGLSVYDWKIAGKTSSEPELVGRFTFAKSDLIPSIPQQISFGTNGDILCLVCEDGTEAVIRRYAFDADTGRIVESSIAHSADESLTAISSFVQDGTVVPFLQSSSGRLENLSGLSLVDIGFPNSLPHVEIMQQNESNIAFGLSHTGSLYANSKLLVKNCTSFILTPAHLIFTTTTHFIKFIHITNLEDLEVPPDDPEVDERCRNVERGARLITACPTAMSVVLQMPRGNLETIYPRAMVLSGIRKLIDEKDYKRAFATCRTQRVDMNLLYDHAPEQFMANAALFIEQVKKISYIDLFLSSLRNEDVTTTLYKETRKTPLNSQPIMDAISQPPASTHNSNPTQKVNTICATLLTILSTKTSTNLQNIITANVSKTPPDLDGGLLVVADLMTKDEGLAEKAVEHICFLADPNRLYDNALGLYNLDLALLVAQQSQKDPREYLPFLQALQEMEVLRRQFSIDNHLGRYEKALGQLHSMGTQVYDEFDAYVEKHALYQSALTLYRYTPPRHTTILTLYAHHLESKSHFHSAALAYESLSLFTPASTCYQRAGAAYFRESLHCHALQTDPLPTYTSSHQLASSLADSLLESKDYLSAAELQATYLTNIPLAIQTLLKGYHVPRALLLASTHLPTHPDLLTPDTGIYDTALSETLSTSLELLSECKSQLLAQLPRIAELRTKALTDPLAFYGEGDAAAEDIPDDISVAASSRLSTNASLYTRYTGRQSAGTAATGVSRQTSKNRRREERKRARGKKGSVYEEEYLVASVGRLVVRVESVRDDIGGLVEGLWRRGMRERARGLEVLCAEVVGMCVGAVRDVWGEKSGEGGEGVVNNGVVTEEEWRPVGGDAVLAESLEAMRASKVAPVIGAFKKLELLGA